MLKVILLPLITLITLHADVLQLPPVLDPKVNSSVDEMPTEAFKRTGPTIQLAILLDSSNSMDGLIAQTKTQIWKIINELSLANKANKEVTLQVALYEYGKSALPSFSGYLQRLSPLTGDLDFVSEKLFGLKTNGGQEYAGWVIQDATNKLVWSSYPDDMRLIIIAGNESFAQGTIPFENAIASAKEKKIIVNTIFCGSLVEGINLGWQKGAKLGGGVYLHINQDAKSDDIPTPFDEQIVALGGKLNDTYIAYGAKGAHYSARQKLQDANAKAMAPSANVERQIAKSKKSYRTTSWDLASAYEEDKSVLDNVEVLPEAYKGKSKEEIQSALQKSLAERKALQKKIDTLRTQRKRYIADNQPKKERDIGAVLIKSLKKQVTNNGFTFKE